MNGVTVLNVQCVWAVDVFLLQILTGRFSGLVTAASKSKGWEELAKEVSAVSGIPRTGQDILKKWTCLKSETKMLAVGMKKKVKETGGGPFEGDVDSSQQRILNVIGAVAVEGVKGGFDSALSETSMRHCF